MPKHLYIALFLLVGLISFSQSSFNLKGTIVDERTKLPIESATVYISSIKDSVVVDYTITDKLGRFNFKNFKKQKPVFLKVSYVSYQDYKVEIQNSNSDKDFGMIFLKENIKSIEEVIIKNEIPPIRIKKDTLEFNAASFKVRPDANVETLLKQLPGVEIDSDGKITVNGKEVNQILVNGKAFFDKDGKIALQNLPANIINKVQVSDTKTKKEEKTREESTSNNASINLTIDEKKNKGFFGKFLIGKGSNDRYESSGLANYFKKKTKISVLASSNNINSSGFSMDEVFDNMGGGRSRSMNSFGDGSFSINGKRFGANSGITQSNIFGINYSDDWSKKTDVSGSYFYSNTNTENIKKSNQTNLLPSGSFTTNSNLETSDDRFGNNFNFELEYEIDSTTSIVIHPKYSKSKGNYRSKSNQVSTDNLNQLLNESSSQNSNDSQSDNFSNSITFTKSFIRKGRHLSATFDNTNNNSNGNSSIQSATILYQGTDPDVIRNQNENTFNKTDQYAFNIEYSEPITDSLKIKISSDFDFDSHSEDVMNYDYDSFTQTYSAKNDLLSKYLFTSTKTINPETGISLNKSKFRVDLRFGTEIIDNENHADYLGLKTDLNKNYMLPTINSNINFKFSKTRNLWFSYNYNTTLPSSSQLLPIEDLSNPLSTYIGNPDLDIIKTHNLNVSYRDFDYATRSGYGFYSGTNLNDSQIVSYTTYDIDRKRTTTYKNVTGTENYWLGIYWNKTFKKDENTFKLGINFNDNLSSSKGFTDGQLYETKTLSVMPKLNFTYEYGELFTVTSNYSYTYNKTNYTNYRIASASNFSHKINVQTTNYWPKNWVFGNDFGYTFNSNITNGFKKDFYLWNTSLSYSFFEKKLMAKVKVYDVLNQNVSSTRNITDTSIRDEENIVLKRYVMFSLTYKVGKFGAKEKRSN